MDIKMNIWLQFGGSYRKQLQRGLLNHLHKEAQELQQLE